MKKAIAILLALVMLLCCFTACGKTEDAPAAGNDAPAAGNDAPAAGNDAAGDTAEPKRTDLKVQLNAEPATLDFHNDQTTARTYIGMNLFANLLTYDEDGQLMGELAESWSHNDDLTEWTFVIKTTGKFSDGTDITMDDVVYSFQRGKDEAFLADYQKIESIEALSDTEVKFVLTAPNGRFDYALANDGWCILSKAYMESGADLTTEAAVTSGAYYLADWTMGTSMTLKANEGYVLGAPEIKEVECIFIPDRNTAVVALESKQVDFLTNGGTLNATEVEVIETFDGVQFVPRPSTSYVPLCPNFQFAPFSDVNIRKAVDLAIDRDYILALLGGTQTAAGIIPINESIGGYLPGYEPHARDLEAAKALMAESSYPDGFSFTVLCNANYVPICEAIQAQLKEIGITMEIEQVADASVIVERINAGTMEAFVTGYSGVTGDIGSWAGLYGGMFNGDKGNEYGPMITAADGLFGAEREAHLKATYDLMTEIVPTIGLYFNNGCWACDENLNYGINNIVSFLRFRSMSWN